MDGKQTASVLDELNADTEDSNVKKTAEIMALESEGEAVMESLRTFNNHMHEAGYATNLVLSAGREIDKIITTLILTRGIVNIYRHRDPDTGKPLGEGN